MEEPPAAADARALSWARWTVVLAGLLWSTSGYFAKAPCFDGWQGPMLAWWRAIFASLFLLPLVRQPRWTWKLLPMIAAFVAMNYTYLTAMQLGTAANAIWLQCTAPAWVLLFGVVFLGEAVRLKDFVMLGFGAVGVGLILLFELRELSVKPQGFAAALWAISSGMLYSTVILSLRILRDQNAVWLIALNHVCTALFLPLLIWAGDWAAGQPLQPVRIPEGVQWIMLAGFGILQMGLPYVLFTRSVRTLPAHEASNIGLIEPILVPVWVFLFWRESPAWWTIVGASLILLGLLMSNVRWTRNSRAGSRLPS